MVEFNQIFILEEGNKFRDIFINYNISAIISGSTDGCLPTLLFDILQAMFLKFSVSGADILLSDKV